MKKSLKILMLEDCADDAEIIQRFLLKKKLYCEFSVAIDKKTYLLALDQFYPDIILSDHSLPQFNSVDALSVARQRFPGIPFIMVTGTVSEGFAADILKSGADDYILKDRLDRLPAAIDIVLLQRQTEKEKIQAAEKLKRSEENYRTIMERVSDGFAALDKDWHYTYVNKKACELLKCQPGELIGRHIWTEFPGWIGGNFYKACLKAMQEQQYIYIEEYNPLDHIWLEDHIYPSPDGLSIFFKDITERKNAEKAIIESEDKYHTLVEQAFDSIIIYTPDLIVLDCNHRACITLGYTPEELKEHNVTGLFFKEDIIARPLYFETLKTGHTTLDYRRLKRKDGTGIEMEIGTKMMPDGNLMAIARDITERKKAEQKIIQSETNLRAIFENTSEGFLLMDRNAVVMAFNNKAADYYFFSREKEIQIGQSIYDCIKISRKAFFQQIIGKALNGESIQYERSYDRENGDTSWIDFSVTPVIEAGQVKGICITGRDITEKKIIEQEREFDRNNLKALINNTNDLMWSVNRDLKLITSNDAFDKMVKTISGKKVAKGIDVLIRGFSKEQLNRFRKYYERAFLGESFTEIEHTDSSDDFCSEISFYPVYNGDAIIGAACFSRDISQRKKAEKEITDYKNALDQSSIVSITDQKGIIKHVNDNFCKISGYSTGELLGQDHRIINSGYHPNAYIKSLVTTIAKGRIWRGEFCNKAKDGSLYWVDATIIPFLNSKGKPVQYLAIANDITEKKLMQQEIIAQKIQEQKKITRAIIKAQEKERNYIGQELHDNINQILASTKLYLEIAGNNNGDVKGLIRYPIELLDSTIQEIRLLSCKLVTPFRNVNLNDLIQQLLDGLCKNKGIITTFDYDLSDLPVSDDLTLNIYRIIQEQLNNIVKHASAKNLSISIQSDNGFINIVVADNGKGFDVNKKRKGIGISNMINRAESFNGEVTIESSPGNGCKISLKIPL